MPAKSILETLQGLSGQTNVPEQDPDQAATGSLVMSAEYTPPRIAPTPHDVALAVLPEEHPGTVARPEIEEHHIGTGPKPSFTLDALNRYSYNELRSAKFADLDTYEVAVAKTGPITLARGLRSQLIVDVGGKSAFLETDEHGELGYHYLFKGNSDLLMHKFKVDVYNRLPPELKEPNDLAGQKGAVLASFTTPSNQTVYDLTADKTFFNRYSRNFVKASCPPRPLTPRYNEQVAKWLELLARDAHDKLLDWLASFTDLTQPTCAIYLYGASRVGKSLFPLGLNRYWNTDRKPTPLWRYFDTFNNDVTRSGLLLADEELSPDRVKFTTTNLRDLITSESHSIFTKNQDAGKAAGCFRVILASNHSNMLDLDTKGLDPASLEAVSIRFLPIEVTKEPADYIRSIGGRGGATKFWVEGDQIIRHALWLRDNRKVTPGVNGLLVEGNYAASRNLLVATGPADMILGLLTDVISGSQLVSGIELDTVFVGDGKIYVVMDRLRSYLEQAMKRPYQRQTLGHALTNLQRTDAKANFRPRILSANGVLVQPRVFDIEPQYLINYMNQTKSGDPDKLEAALRSEAIKGNGRFAGLGDGQKNIFPPEKN